MYAIETELGRFEAETEKDAKKALRAAMKRQETIDADENRKYQKARLVALSVGFRIYEQSFMTDHAAGALPRGWRYFNHLDDYTCKEIHEDGRRGYEIDTENGRAKVFPYDPIVGYVENGAGFCIAVAIANQDMDLFAVGVFEDRLVWHGLTGIKITQFRTA